MTYRIYHGPGFSLNKTHWNTKILHCWSSGIRKMSDGSRFETFGSICCFIFKNSSTVNRDLAGYSETSLPKYQSPRRHIPYDNNLQIHQVTVTSIWVMHVLQFEDAFSQAERCETVWRGSCILTWDDCNIEIRTTFYPILMHRLANVPKGHDINLSGTC